MGDDAEAKLEIHEVLYQYCRSMDRMDAALALDCFEPDARVLDRAGAPIPGLFAAGER
jgi:hypothetical protein